MLTSLSAVNITSMQTALKMSEVLKEITYRSEELSVSAQVRSNSSSLDSVALTGLGRVSVPYTVLTHLYNCTSMYNLTIKEQVFSV